MLLHQVFGLGLLPHRRNPGDLAFTSGILHGAMLSQPSANRVVCCTSPTRSAAAEDFWSEEGMAVAGMLPATGNMEWKHAD